MSDLTIDSITQPISEWALDYGIPADLIELRLKAGWSPKDAVETEMPFTARGLQTHKRHLRSGSPEPRYEVHGRNLTIGDWSVLLGVQEQTLKWRLSQGWLYQRVFSSRRYNKADY